MTDPASRFLLPTILILATILLVFGMKYLSAARRTGAQAATEETYRRIAERSAEAQSAGAASLAAIQADVAELKARLAALEAILKEVG